MVKNNILNKYLRKDKVNMKKTKHFSVELDYDTISRLELVLKMSGNTKKEWLKEMIDIYTESFTDELEKEGDMEENESFKRLRYYRNLVKCKNK